MYSVYSIGPRGSVKIVEIQVRKVIQASRLEAIASSLEVSLFRSSAVAIDRPLAPAVATGRFSFGASTGVRRLREGANSVPTNERKHGQLDMEKEHVKQKRSLCCKTWKDHCIQDHSFTTMLCTTLERCGSHRSRHGRDADRTAAVFGKLWRSR